MLNLEQRAQEALKLGQTEKRACVSKQEVLDLISMGKADAMSVRSHTFSLDGEVSLLDHTAIRFHDRELGEAVRQATMHGFGLTDRT